jgi:hypothetical protein
MTSLIGSTIVTSAMTVLTDVSVTMTEADVLANGVPKGSLKKLKSESRLDADGESFKVYSLTLVMPLIAIAQGKVQKKKERAEEEMAKAERKLIKEREAATPAGIAKVRLAVPLSCCLPLLLLTGRPDALRLSSCPPPLSAHLLTTLALAQPTPILQPGGGARDQETRRDRAQGGARARG